jgi:signal transduction histidine kinase
LRITSVIKSERIRLAAIFSALFLTLAGVLMGTVLWIVEETQTAALQRENDEDIETVTNGFNDEGVPEAIEVIKQRVGFSKYSPSKQPDCYMVLENAQGEALAGNLPAQPRQLGVFYDNPRGEHLLTLLGRGVEITPGNYLFVGRDTRLLSESRDRIVYAFAWVAVGALAIAIVAGVVLARRFALRVDAVARACKSIVAGRLDERIELPGHDDEWQRLGGAINHMLNRISALVENLRQVSSDVAHDLRTPLTRMRNRLEDARSGSSSRADYAEAVSAAITDTDQLLSMFEAVLRISQVEAGSRLSNFSSVSLSELCEKVFRMYLPVAEDYRHRLAASIESGIVIRGDEELLTQMFTNLIENAIHHTPDHTQIRFDLERDANGILVSVSDNGPGIPADQTEKVLRRFYRLTQSRTTAGHGLGLALVAAVVQLHDGRLTLEDAQPGLRVTTRIPGDGRGAP